VSLRTALAGLVIALSGGTAFGWGDAGHRFVAEIAQTRLSATARAAVDQLLALESTAGVPGCVVSSLPDAATWADCLRRYRDNWEYTFAWHFDDAPLCGEAVREQYCAEGRCLSAQVSRLTRVLADRGADPGKRLEALKFVVHLVGDAHQPLHAIDNHDRGGNEIRVRLTGSPEPRQNLHHVWDTDLVNHALDLPDPVHRPARAARAGRERGEQRPAIEPLAPGELAERVARAAREAIVRLPASTAESWRAGTIFDWMAESHERARTMTYAALPGPLACNAPPSRERLVLDGAYVEPATEVVREQLLKAGVRLAEVLEQALR
jgi:hypothetical protein